MPGIPAERYWYYRHEAVYEWLRGSVLTGAVDPGAWVLDAGCGEGYGAQLLKQTATSVVALDYDAAAIAHVARAYPQLSAVRGNLTALPFPAQTFAAVVSLQVIEHIWDLPGFLRECHRILRPGSVVAVSTPNRPVFSPGLPRGATPTNPFHVEEFDAEQVAKLLAAAGFTDVGLAGLHHGPRIAAWERVHGSIVAAHIREVLDGVPNPDLTACVASIDVSDFVIADTTDSHDLIGWARR